MTIKKRLSLLVGVPLLALFLSVSWQLFKVAAEYNRFGVSLKELEVITKGSELIDEIQKERSLMSRLVGDESQSSRKADQIKATNLFLEEFVKILADSDFGMQVTETTKVIVSNSLISARSLGKSPDTIDDSILEYRKAVLEIAGLAKIASKHTIPSFSKDYMTVLGLEYAREGFRSLGVKLGVALKAQRELSQERLTSIVETYAKAKNNTFSPQLGLEKSLLDSRDSLKKSENWKSTAKVFLDVVKGSKTGNYSFDHEESYQFTKSLAEEIKKIKANHQRFMKENLEAGQSTDFYIMIAFICVFGSMVLGMTRFAKKSMNNITAPLRETESVLGFIAAGNLNCKVKYKGKDEIGSMAVSLNKCIATLEAQNIKVEDSLKRAEKGEKEANAAKKDAMEKMKKAVQAEKEAANSAEEARLALVEAEEAKSLSEQESQKALLASEEAEREKAKAEQAAKLASNEAEKAQRAMEEAKLQKEKALNSAKDAEAEKEFAQKALEEAEQAKAVANEEKKKAEKASESVLAGKKDLEKALNSAKELEAKAIEAERHAKEAEKEQREHKLKLEASVEKTLSVVKAVKDGDLTKRFDFKAEGLIGDVVSALDELFLEFRMKLQKIEELSQKVNQSTIILQDSGQSMSQNSTDTRTRSENVMNLVESVNTSMAGLDIGSEQSSLAIAEISKNSQEASNLIDQSAKIASNTLNQIQSLSDQSNEISDFAKIINTIAEQTNLLALNASIESARAGDHGKGFSVVATEVKELANQTAGATEEIVATTKKIQESISSNIKAVNDIVESISTVNELSTSIAAAIEEQTATLSESSKDISGASKASEEIQKEIVQVNNAAEITKNMAQESVSSIQALVDVSASLKEIVDRFTLREEEASEDFDAAA
ncbi:MAG: HAMP domain-containing protein [Pseudobacteriovorax sp.]|nr:HAMP domain-containing protein [Pseudobacteriovorax sp.]